MDTLQITIETKDETLRALLVADLSEAGFDAFEERENELLACCPADRFDPESLRAVEELLKGQQLAYTKEIIAQQNWNAQWEAGYEPVVIQDFCIVRAQFHPPAAGFEHEIIITPKMSFGTGHHATTKAMMLAMRRLDLKNKSVLDFGAGTGILSILAAKLGAKTVLAIDHEEWAAENAVENAALNAAENIVVRQGSLEQAGSRRFDVILANINRHILLQYMGDINRALLPGGALLLSGILAEDEPAITATAEARALKPSERWIQDGWLALLFTSSPQEGQ